MTIMQGRFGGLEILKAFGLSPERVRGLKLTISADVDSALVAKIEIERFVTAEELKSLAPVLDDVEPEIVFREIQGAA